MTEQATPKAVTADAPALTEEQQKQLESFIEEEEGATNRVGGWVGIMLTAVAVAVSLYHLYAAYDIVPAYIFRPSHVACVLFLTFLLFPALPRFRDRMDWCEHCEGTGIEPTEITEEET